jgi:hypothetical protein
MLVAICLAFFLLDINGQGGLASGFFYIAPVVFSLRLGSAAAVVRTALAVSLLNAAALLLVRSDLPLHDQCLGRLLALVVIWSVAMIVIRPARDASVRPPDSTPAVPSIEEGRLRLLRQKRELQTLLARGVIHSVNNMLMVAQSNADLVRTLLPAGSDCATPAGDVCMAAGEIGSAVGRWQQFSRDADDRVQTIELGGFLEDGMQTMHYLLPKTVQFDGLVNDAGGALAATARPNDLLQMLLSLGYLVRDALPQGGRLTARLETRPATGADDDGEERTLARLWMEAHGAGDRPIQLHDSDDPLLRAETLEAIRELAAIYDGHFEAHSRPGGLLQLAVTLPCARLEVQPAPEDSLIVLVEDHGYTRAMTSAVLSGEGLSVATCRTIDEALEKHPLTDPRPRVLFADETRIAGLSPDRLRVLQEWADRGRLILAGPPDSADSSYLSGCVPRVKKPYSIASLSALMRSALRAQCERESTE